jgi:hypothetical protein
LAVKASFDETDQIDRFKQGDQIWRNLAPWVKVYFGQLFEKFTFGLICSTV